MPVGLKSIVALSDYRDSEGTYVEYALRIALY